MNNTIQLFANPEFGEIRTIKQADEIYFVGKDVAEILGYTNSRKALIDHVDPEDKTDGVTIRDAMGREQTPVAINESGLYSLVLSSKLSSAKRFKRWVTSEVLPALRRDGGYMVADANETPEELVARALRVAQQTIDRQKAQIDEMRPKALFADAVGASDNTCLVGELAKMLRQNGVEIGATRLFKVLRNTGYLGKAGSHHNVPTQKAMELELFRIKETAIKHADGHVTLSRTPKVTGAGQTYFIKRFINGHLKELEPCK